MDAQNLMMSPSNDEKAKAAKAKAELMKQRLSIKYGSKKNLGEESQSSSSKSLASAGAVGSRTHSEKTQGTQKAYTSRASSPPPGPLQPHASSKKLQQIPPRSVVTPRAQVSPIRDGSDDTNQMSINGIAQLETQMESMALQESQKTIYREALVLAEAQAQQQQRRRLVAADFEPLSVVGRGAFGEVRLVRMKDAITGDYEVYGE